MLEKDSLLQGCCPIGGNRELKEGQLVVSCSSCCDGVHSTTSLSPPPLLPLIRGRYRRTCTSLLRYKVSFHLLTEVTGFPCIQHRGKRTHWGWIDYLRGGCSLSTQHREGWQAVGGCFFFFFKTLFGYKKVSMHVAGFTSVYEILFSDTKYDLLNGKNRFYINSKKEHIISNQSILSLKALCVFFFFQIKVLRFITASWLCTGSPCSHCWCYGNLMVKTKFKEIMMSGQNPDPHESWCYIYSLQLINLGCSELILSGEILITRDLKLWN